MITVIEVKSIVNGKEVAELACLSTDTKPTEYANGSLILEMDTGKFYAYNEDGTEWVEIGGTSTDNAEGE